MKLLGYSERGIINSLFYEIRYSANPESLLQALLAKIQFPFIEKIILPVLDAEVIVEQSFSDFGDADGLLLINTGQNKVSIFLEGKVKPSWTVRREFEKFINGTHLSPASSGHSSNLFTQLYHKVRLVDCLRESGLSILQAGIPFPPCSSKSIRKIGKNGIVLKAVEKLANYLDSTYYIALLPDKRSNLEDFFENHLNQIVLEDHVGWNVQSYGYLALADAEEFCVEHRLHNTLQVFEFNLGQLYNR